MKYRLLNAYRSQSAKVSKRSQEQVSADGTEHRSLGSWQATSLGPAAFHLLYVTLHQMHQRRISASYAKIATVCCERLQNVMGLAGELSSSLSDLLRPCRWCFEVWRISSHSFPMLPHGLSSPLG